MRRLRRPSDLSAQATEQIRSAILRGDLLPGSRIRQEELAARLAVSRAPIRQALLVLEREGLVLNDRLHGATVRPLDAELIRDLYGFREGIERYVAETLARRSDIEWGPIDAVLEAGRDSATSDASAMIELDLRFHTLLYDAVGNRILSEVMRGQWFNMRRAMSATLTISGYPRLIWEEHTAIAEAIRAGDVEGAGRLAAAHTAAASTRLIERLQESPGNGAA